MDVLDAFIFDRTTSLDRAYLAAPDAATTIFNLEDCRVLGTQILDSGHRRIQVESTVESGGPECGVIGTCRHSRRCHRFRAWRHRSSPPLICCGRGCWALMNTIVDLDTGQILGVDQTHQKDRPWLRQQHQLHESYYAQERR